MEFTHYIGRPTGEIICDGCNDSAEVKEISRDDTVSEDARTLEILPVGWRMLVTLESEEDEEEDEAHFLMRGPDDCGAPLDDADICGAVGVKNFLRAVCPRCAGEMRGMCASSRGKVDIPYMRST